MASPISENNSILNRDCSKKKKFDFKKMKKNTICSLNEVECFLNKFQKFSKCFKLYKILK